ncbi:hypothetical protein Tco_1269319, partial [Tanacetum coccineum]
TNPLALVAQQQPVYHHQNHPTQNTQYYSSRSQQSTKNRGKAVVTSSAPTYNPEPDTVTEDEQMSKEKEIDKLRDGENLDKMKEKGDACIFVGYSTQSKAYRVFNKRTRMIVETIHVNFDELPQMTFDHNRSCLEPQLSTEVHQAVETITTSNELDLLFGPLFDEYFNRENQVVLKSSAVTTIDASNKRQQPDSTSSTSTLATTVTANGNFDL